MNVLFLSFLLLSLTWKADACKAHNPPIIQVPQTFLGTVEQGCTPGAITTVSALLTDPSKCDLPLGPSGCNLCKLRLYRPVKTTSRFEVQPLTKDFSTVSPEHVEATKCKCSDGCYFHESSISRFGGYPLPSDVGSVGKFSEPFACFSGISMPTGPAPTFTYLIWCESDGGCPNPVVARYNFVIALELLSPNRPATKSLFIPRILTLPKSKCLQNEMDPATKDFIRGKTTTPPVTRPPRTTKPSLKAECSKCRRAKECRTRKCVQSKCVRSSDPIDLVRCGLGGGGTGQCDKAERLGRCVKACVASN